MIDGDKVMHTEKTQTHGKKVEPKYLVTKWYQTWYLLCHSGLDSISCCLGVYKHLEKKKKKNQLTEASKFRLLLKLQIKENKTREPKLVTRSAHPQSKRKHLHIAKVLNVQKQEMLLITCHFCQSNTNKYKDMHRKLAKSAYPFCTMWRDKLFSIDFPPLHCITHNHNHLVNVNKNEKC